MYSSTDYSIFLMYIYIRPCFRVWFHRRIGLWPASSSLYTLLGFNYNSGCTCRSIYLHTVNQAHVDSLTLGKLCVRNLPSLEIRDPPPDLLCDFSHRCLSTDADVATMMLDIFIEVYPNSAVGPIFHQTWVHLEWKLVTIRMPTTRLRSKAKTATDRGSTVVSYGTGEVDLGLRAL